MKLKERKLVYTKSVKNPDRKWYQFWKAGYIDRTYQLVVNKKGELVVGKLLKCVYSN